MRTAPVAEPQVGCAVCGSHLTHSHCGPTPAVRRRPRPARRPGCATARTARRRPGPGARAAGSPSGFEPDVAAGLQRQRDRQLGHHGVRRAGSRRNASAVTGSKPSGGPDSGGIRRVARRWAPRPMRTCAEVGVGRLAFPQPPAASTAGHAAGFGMRGLRGDARCAAAASCDRAPHLAEVAQVVAAVLVDGGRPRRTPAPAAGGHHAERGDREHAAEQPRRGVADAEDDDEARTSPASITSGSSRISTPPGTTFSGSGGAWSASSPPVGVAARGGAVRPRRCP